MRVLCSTTPMEEVFAPFVPLGKALLAASHEVLVVAGPDLLPRVAGEGFATRAAGPTAMEGAIEAMGDPAVAAAPEGEPWHIGGAMFGAVIAPAEARRLLREAAEQFRPDLVLHPPVDLAAPLLATQLGLASVTYGFGRTMASPHVQAFSTRVAPLWEQNGLAPDPCAGLYRCRYLDPSPPVLHGEPTTADPVRRPLRPELPGDASATLPGWVTQGRAPLVYLSLGTRPALQPAGQIPGCLLADLAGEDIEIAVTIGELNDPAALGKQPTNVHIERWLLLAPLPPKCRRGDLPRFYLGPPWPRWSAACSWCWYRKGRISSPTPPLVKRPGWPRCCGRTTFLGGGPRYAVRAVLADGSAPAASARRAAEQIATMPDAAEKVAKDLQELASRIQDRPGIGTCCWRTPRSLKRHRISLVLNYAV